MPVEQQVPERFEGHCIVELMGHNVIAGYVTEQVIAGAAMLRVDVPEVSEDRPKFTKFFASSAVYGVTPTTEENVRVAAGKLRARPIDLWILPNPPPALPPARDNDNYDDYPDDGHDDDASAPSGDMPF